MHAYGCRPQDQEIRLVNSCLYIIRAFTNDSGPVIVSLLFLAPFSYCCSIYLPCAEYITRTNVNRGSDADR